MSELRKDPILGRWVIIATERAKRPTDFKVEPEQSIGGFCPFCAGNEDKTPPEIAAIRDDGSQPNSPGWRVRVVPNKFPALRIEGDLGKAGYGVYDMMNGIGAHEVIIETPEHHTSMVSLTDEHVADIIWMYRERLADLKNDKRLVYGIIFKNVGRQAGASLEHTHSQLIAMPVIPNLVAREIRGAREFYNYRGRCIYCDIIQQEIATESRVEQEDDMYLSFAPFAARFPFETWVVPKNHFSHFEDITREEVEVLAKHLRLILAKLEKALSNPPYNFVIHTAPLNSGELEEYHWHIEIIPRLTKVAGFEWGTGFYINPIPPESAAEFVRQVEVDKATEGAVFREHL